jgi:pimeloyl-ACP methyl ester carboxylesterase
MDKFIAVGETKVHYIEQGQGKPMILLHGSHYSADTWKTIGLIDALSPLVRVIAIDLPGFGASEPLKYAD